MEKNMKENKMRLIKEKIQNGIKGYKERDRHDNGDEIKRLNR